MQATSPAPAALDPPRGLGAVLRRLWHELQESGDLDRVQVAAPALPHEPIRDEKTEQRQIKQMLDACKIAYFDTSQPFHPLITPGLPDLLCFDASEDPTWRLFFIEVKRRGEKQSRAQRLFQECCTRAGIPYVCGSTEEVAAFLGLENAR